MGEMAYPDKTDIFLPAASRDRGPRRHPIPSYAQNGVDIRLGLPLPGKTFSELLAETSALNRTPVLALQ